MLKLSDLDRSPVSLVVAYALLVGILYQWGYWGTFNVNILQFMSLTDIVKSFAYPFVSSFAAFFLGIVMGTLVPTQSLPPGEGRQTVLGQFLYRWRFVLLWGYFGLVFAVWRFAPPSERWFLAAAMATPVVALFVSNFSVVQQLLPNSVVRQLAAFTATAMPLFAFAYGSSHAEAVLSGRSYFETRLSPGDAPSKYLGIAGERLFLLSADNKVITIHALSDQRAIPLTHIRQ